MKTGRTSHENVKKLKPVLRRTCGVLSGIDVLQCAAGES